MLLCCSFDYRGCSFSLLESLARHCQAIRDALADPSLARGIVVLSTCNRFEVYLDAVADDPAGEVLDRIAAICGVPRAGIETQARCSTGRNAAEHLIAVASGLESVALGEEEISGQVRRAHTEACEAGTNSHRLERVFQAATRTSRLVKQRTGLGADGRSLVGLALRLAEARVPSWTRARVLLIGTGAYAGAVVSALRSRGAVDISVHSPSGRAVAYAGRHGLEPVDPARFHIALAEAEIVIACSRVEEPLLTGADFAAAPSAHRRLVLDLGMPRNVDPGVAHRLEGDLLDIETIGKHAEVSELSAEAEALQIVREAALALEATEAERDALPSVLALRRHVLSILEDELCRARRTEPDGGADGRTGERSEQVRVEEALHHFTARLLHSPVTRMRALGREGRAEEAHAALGVLFGVQGEQGN